METFTIEFDLTEMAKLNAICGAAIISEEECLERYPNGPHVDMTKASIAKIKSIKAKIKSSLEVKLKNVLLS